MSSFVSSIILDSIFYYSAVLWLHVQKLLI